MKKLMMRRALQYTRHSHTSVWEKNGKFSTAGRMIIDGVARSDAEMFQVLKKAQERGFVTQETSAFGSKEALHIFRVTDMGRREARGRKNGLTVEAARKMHDSDLSSIWGDHPVAKKVLAGRTKAAAFIRLIVARVFAREDMMTFFQWHVVPCLTDKGTLGVLDIAKGTAWDTGVEAPEEVADLGLEEGVYAAANGAEGTVYIDGKPVQHAGTAVVDGKVVPPKMPAGWRQIALPTWRGYEGTSPYRPIPTTEFNSEQWVKPLLAASGLMTCYGEPGDPKAGEALTRTFGWHKGERNAWPNGVPDWIVVN